MLFFETLAANINSAKISLFPAKIKILHPERIDEKIKRKKKVSIIELRKQFITEVVFEFVYFLNC